MRVCFLGGTHAAQTMAEAARRRGHEVTDADHAKIVFIAKDTPTGEDGSRDLSEIRKMVTHAYETYHWAAIVLCSQVPPGFTRSLDLCGLVNLAETIRIEDAIQRMMHPEMFVIGTMQGDSYRVEIRRYLESFDCPIFQGSWEDAEFAKIAINMTLASQVESATRLAKAASHYKADWGFIQRVLRHDSRIGKFAYLTPGDWRKSSHLLRDAKTLEDAGL